MDNIKAIKQAKRWLEDTVLTERDFVLDNAMALQDAECVEVEDVCVDDASKGFGKINLVRLEVLVTTREMRWYVRRS